MQSRVIFLYHYSTYLDDIQYRRTSFFISYTVGLKDFFVTKDVTRSPHEHTGFLT